MAHPRLGWPWLPTRIRDIMHNRQVRPLPHRASPELEAMRKAVLTALEIRDEADILRGVTRGELEARVLAAERVRASAPPEVSAVLRLTALAEADGWQQAASAAAQGDHSQAVNAEALASQIGAERHRLEAASPRYEQWSAATASIRATADKAQAELERRSPARQPQVRDQAEIEM